MILAVAGNGSVIVDNGDAVSNVNNTFHKISTESFNFEKNPNLITLTIACAFTCVWFLFIAFYNSQILGFIVTKLLQRFVVPDGHLHIGSFSVSLLSGKVMFKNVQYVTKDYSCQIVDGLAIFKWWLRYDSSDLKYYKNLKKDSKDADLQSQNCRLVFFLNGLEVHYYNRFDVYKDIEDRLKCERYGDAGTSTFSNDNVNSSEEQSDTSESDTTLSLWRELFPLVQMKIRSGKLAIGNRLVETTMWVHFNSGEAAYSCPDATSELDNFTHFFKCNCTDVRMLLSNSPGYTGPKSEPPSFMGDGFTVLQSAQATVTYFMDEPGVVPPDLDVSSMSDPEWGLDVKFQKNAKIWYGPWVDQQRFMIQKYFFPNDFRELPVTKPAEREELRVHSGFDVNVEFPKETTFHLLFTKNEETSAMHIVCSDITTFHYYQPWIVNEYGYSNNIIAHFQNIEISSSMTFQKICECETVEINLNVTMPRMWNSFQCLKCEVWLTKTTCYYINDQLDFFGDLSKDWSSKEPPDIAKFLPYEWDFHLYIRDFELILFANQFNWIDCTTTRTDDENNQMALCGETLDVSFNLAFTDFLPETVETKFFFRGETVILRSFLPVSNTLRRSVISLAHSSDKHMYPKFSYVASTETCLDAGADESMDKQTENGMDQDEQLSKGWRHRTGESDHWIDVWSVPVLVLNLYYNYHPVHFETEEISSINRRCGLDYTKEEANKLAPDVITVELEAGPSAVRIFGTFWRQFFAGIKENYFGASEHIHEFNASKTKKDANKHTRATTYNTAAATTTTTTTNNNNSFL